MKTYKYNNDTVHLEFGEYKNGRTNITLIDHRTGEDYLIATVNIPEVFLLPGEVIIKTWSENKHMLDFLTKNFITSSSKRHASNDFVTAHIVNLL